DAMISTGERNQSLPIFDLYVCCIHNRQTAALQSLRRNEVQNLKGFITNGLIVLIVAHQSATVIGTNDLSRQEVLARKSGLARPGRSNQRYQRKLGNVQQHLVNTPICVGEPTSGSFGPIGRNRTL